MIVNKTTTKILAKNNTICNSPLCKFIGLMFSRKKSVVFIFDRELRVSLHMFFVFFPIDAIFLNSKKRVVEIKKNFVPFTFYFPKKKAKYIIEVPASDNAKMKIGDLIGF